MIINFKTREISRDTPKLVRIPILIKKKAETHQPRFVAETNFDPPRGR